MEFDVVVIGSGIAGLSFALRVAEGGGRVAIITKKTSAESNTNYAQGGIAAVTSASDDIEIRYAEASLGVAEAELKQSEEINRRSPGSVSAWRRMPCSLEARSGSRTCPIPSPASL